MTAPSPLRFGFRRRCAWCGVVLRGWQLNCCRRCKRAVVYSPSPWCVSGSRWDAEPDAPRSLASAEESGAVCACHNTRGCSLSEGCSRDCDHLTDCVYGEVRDV
jgi:hypothetical protein